MQLTFSPMRREEQLTLSRVGDVLTINGEAFDFSGVPAGATLPRDAIACDWIAGDVERDGTGALTVPLILPHGANAPEETRFPIPITVTADGAIALPPYDKEPEA